MSDILAQIKALIQFRHLLWDLAVKDIEIRYRSPALGFLWAILIPLTTILVFKLVFSVIMKIEIEDYPYFIYLMTAVFPWSYFSSSINTATESILNNRELIKKAYFPRQIIPVSVILANLINFFPAVIVMLLMLVIFRMHFTILIFLLPAVILLQTIFSIGLALILSTLQVFFRDVRYIVELGIMIWFYLSPAFYSLALIANASERFFKFYLLNPFVGLFTLYRIVLLDGFAKTLPSGINILGLIVWTVMVCILVFVLGLSVFEKYNSHFSDLV